MLCEFVRSSTDAERDNATISQIIWYSLKHALLFAYAHAVNVTLLWDDSSYAVWLCPAPVQ
jgi:hypothetical protein